MYYHIYNILGEQCEIQASDSLKEIIKDTK